MRKRILIGLIAVVVIGVVVFFVSQRNRGSVEWHKSRYLKELYGPPWRHWALYFGWRRGQQSIEVFDWHQRALLKAGYLEERILTAPNVPLSNFSYAVNIAARKKGTNFEFYSVQLSGSNDIRVVNLKGTVPTIDDVLDEVGSAANTEK